MKAFYEKELGDSPIYILGKSYRFDLMETEDPDLIKHLDSAASKHIGGVIKITAEQYAQKKTAKISNPSSPKQYKREEVKQRLVPQSPQLRSRNPRGNAVANVKPEAAAALSVSQSQDISAFVPKISKGVLS